MVGIYPAINENSDASTIKKPKVEIYFGYSKRRPFQATIMRRKKERQKYLKRTITKKCKTCGHETTKQIYKCRMVWSSWKVIKEKTFRSKKFAIKQAIKWYESHKNRKLRAEKVIFT